MTKYWKPLVLITLVAFSLCAIYLAGYTKADEHWQSKWSQRDKQDAQALAQRQIDVANRDVSAARAA